MFAIPYSIFPAFGSIFLNPFSRKGLTAITSFLGTILCSIGGIISLRAVGYKWFVPKPNPTKAFSEYTILCNTLSRKIPQANESIRYFAKDIRFSKLGEVFLISLEKLRRVKTIFIEDANYVPIPTFTNLCSLLQLVIVFSPVVISICIIYIMTTNRRSFINRKFMAGGLLSLILFSSMKILTYDALYYALTKDFDLFGYASISFVPDFSFFFLNASEQMLIFGLVLLLFHVCIAPSCISGTSIDNPLFVDCSSSLSGHQLSPNHAYYIKCDSITHKNSPLPNMIENNTLYSVSMDSSLCMAARVVNLNPSKCFVVIPSNNGSFHISGSNYQQSAIHKTSEITNRINVISLAQAYVIPVVFCAFALIYAGTLLYNPLVSINIKADDTLQLVKTDSTFKIVKNMMEINNYYDLCMESRNETTCKTFKDIKDVYGNIVKRTDFMNSKNSGNVNGIDHQFINLVEDKTVYTIFGCILLSLIMSFPSLVIASLFMFIITPMIIQETFSTVPYLLVHLKYTKEFYSMFYAHALFLVGMIFAAINTIFSPVSPRIPKDIVKGQYKIQ